MVSPHSRGDDPGVVMENRRSWMVSEAFCRREGGRTEIPGANGWVEGQVDVG